MQGDPSASLENNSIIAGQNVVQESNNCIFLKKN